MNPFNNQIPSWANPQPKERRKKLKHVFVFLSEQILQYQNKKDDESHETYLDYVLDITIAYPDGEPIDLPDIVTGIREPCQTNFLYRLYHSSEVNEPS